jgi:hypothetical protein
MILGDFGEISVLDWGLAKLMNRPDDGELDELIHGNYVYFVFAKGSDC